MWRLPELLLLNFLVVRAGVVRSLMILGKQAKLSRLQSTDQRTQKPGVFLIGRQEQSQTTCWLWISEPVGLSSWLRRRIKKNTIYHRRSKSIWTWLDQTGQ